MRTQRIKGIITCNKNSRLHFDTTVLTNCELTEEEQIQLITKSVLNDSFKSIFPTPHEIKIINIKKASEQQTVVKNGTTKLL